MSPEWLAVLAAGLFAVYVWLKICYPYFWKDLFFQSKLIFYGMKIFIDKARGSVYTVLDRFINQAKRTPNKPFVIYNGSVHTYRDIDLRSNRLANVFLEKVRLKKGDCVAMFMSNDPDFLCVWFGLTKVGCSVAFLNIYIKSQSLLHCINCCGAKTLIVGPDLVEVVDQILPTLLENNIQVWTMKHQSEHSQMHTLLDKVDAASDQPVPAALRAITDVKSITLYIFTSGTTGLPKAAVITHLQTLKASAGFRAFGATENDVIYTPLPLYHSSGAMIGIGGTINLGATCILKKKFTATQFWNDCRTHNVTIFQYIGEVCRYLCNRPQTELDQVHKIRMGVGNGLRPDVWREFHRRFGNIKMCEVYGATEGNLCFMNHIGKIGAVGRSNFLYNLIIPFCLVKYDMENDEPVRDQYGFCQEVKTGETGLLLSKVNSISPFFGYAGNRQLTENKLMRNVFVEGDTYVNSGDLMSVDQEGFISFRDRVGDTFRWKGENVATTEVSETLGVVDFIEEVNVYGVEVPGHEGRAGMAAVIIREGLEFDGRKLFEHATRDLPTYARPLFIRLQEVMEITSTFKQQKFQLVQSGFNPSAISDPLFVVDNQQESYIPLTDEIYQSIITGGRML